MLGLQKMHSLAISYLRPMTRCCSAILVLVLASACSDNAKPKDCFLIAASPNEFGEFGRCAASGNLVHIDENYRIYSETQDEYVFIGDLRIAWSENIDNFKNQQVTAVGRYQLLENQFPSLIEINEFYATDNGSLELAPAQ